MFKVGDRVMLRRADQYKRYEIYFVPEMQEYVGDIVTLTKVEYFDGAPCYSVDRNRWLWLEAWMVRIGDNRILPDDLIQETV